MREDRLEYQKKYDAEHREERKAYHQEWYQRRKSQEMNNQNNDARINFSHRIEPPVTVFYFLQLMP